MVGRIAIIVAAYVVASVAAGMMVVLGFAAPRLIDDPRANFHFGIMSLMAVAAIIVILLASALPTLLTVIYAERSRKRSARFYAAAGALNGLVSIAIYYMVAIWRSGFGPRLSSGLTPTEATIRLAGGLALFALTGAMAGLIYWAIAGRRAGLPR